MAGGTRSSQGSQHAAHSADDGWIMEEKEVDEEGVRDLVTKMDCGISPWSRVFCSNARSRSFGKVDAAGCRLRSF